MKLIGGEKHDPREGMGRKQAERAIKNGTEKKKPAEKPRLRVLEPVFFNRPPPRLFIKRASKVFPKHF